MTNSGPSSWRNRMVLDRQTARQSPLAWMSFEQFTFKNNFKVMVPVLLAYPLRVVLQVMQWNLSHVSLHHQRTLTVSQRSALQQISVVIETGTIYLRLRMDSSDKNENNQNKHIFQTNSCWISSVAKGRKIFLSQILIRDCEVQLSLDKYQTQYFSAQKIRIKLQLQFILKLF